MPERSKPTRPTTTATTATRATPAPAAKPANALPASGATRLHHAALRARDVEATVAFYVEVLGLEVVRSEPPRSVWLGLGDDSVLMIEARAAGEPGVPAGSLELLAFRADETRKSRVRELALERGWFDGETAHTVYLRDPDGRRVGLSTYPLPSPSGTT